MPFTPFAVTLPLAASTPVAGYTLINGTGTVPGMTWTAPTDGQMHRVLLIVSLNVTVAETGGQMRLQSTLPNGSVFGQNFLANQAVGNNGTVVGAQVQSGTTVTVSQNSALTAGAATFWADLFAE